MRQKARFGQALKLFWSNYVNFKGRSRRSEFWYAMLWNLIFMIPGIIGLFLGYVFIISGAISNKEGSLLFGGACLIIGGLWYLIYSLATLIPNLAILVRRFHDLSLSMLIPICFIVANFIIYIISNIIVENPNTPENGYALTFIMILNIFIWVFSIYVLVMTCLNSKKETNKYGPSPKFTDFNYSLDGENHNPLDKDE